MFFQITLPYLLLEDLDICWKLYFRYRPHIFLELHDLICLAMAKIHALHKIHPRVKGIQWPTWQYSSITELHVSACEWTAFLYTGWVCAVDRNRLAQKTTLGVWKGGDCSWKRPRAQPSAWTPVAKNPDEEGVMRLLLLFQLEECPHCRPATCP